MARDEVDSSPYAGGAPSLVMEGRLESSKLICEGVEIKVPSCPLKLCVDCLAFSIGFSIFGAALAGRDGLLVRERLNILVLVFLGCDWSKWWVVGEVVMILGGGIAGKGGASELRYVEERAESEACRNLSRENR